MVPLWSRGKRCFRLQLGALRTERALSQQELATAASVSRTAVMWLEAGGVARGLTIRKLARALKVRVGEFAVATGKVSDGD